MVVEIGRTWRRGRFNTEAQRHEDTEREKDFNRVENVENVEGVINRVEL